MTTTKQELISAVSACLDKEIAKLYAWHQAEIEKFNADKQAEIEQFKFEIEKVNKLNNNLTTELERVKSKLTNYAQTEDMNKFQKRTIASLTAEISTMQGTITTLEKRLKLKEKEVTAAQPPHQLQPERHPQPESKPEPQSQPESKPERQPEPQPESEQIQEEQQEEEPELIPVVLQSGTYFWDPDSNDLYEYVSEEEAGELVGLIKSVRIKNNIYYLDTTDNSFYEVTEDKNIGKYLGQIVDRKAVFQHGK